MEQYSSALNILSGEEIEIRKTDKYTPVIKLLENLRKEYNPIYDSLVDSFAESIARVHSQLSNDTFPGIYYSVGRKRFVAAKMINCKRVHIKTSPNFIEVYEALMNFEKSQAK